MRAENSSELLEVPVLPWSMKVEEEAHKMPGESRGILHRTSVEKKGHDLVLVALFKASVS